MTCASAAGKKNPYNCSSEDELPDEGAAAEVETEESALGGAKGREELWRSPSQTDRRTSSLSSPSLYLSFASALFATQLIQPKLSYIYKIVLIEPRI